ncbi:MAG: hypothetical protein H6805_10260 [Planctomycetes bacterium]|nr:hypothetical protein [Planctomycetota bacterium]
MSDRSTARGGPGRSAQPPRCTRPSRLPFGWAGAALLLLPTLALAAWVVLTPGDLSGRTGRAWADDGDTGTINVVQPVAIQDFLRAIAQETGKPILWDPENKQIKSEKIQGALKLTGPKEQLFDMARALLTFYDLIMVPVGPPEFQALLVTDSKSGQTTLRLKPEYVKLTDENVAIYERLDGQFITTTIRVENMRDLKNARAALQRIVSQGNVGNVTEVPQARAFVVTDFAPNVASVYRLLKEMDVQPPSSALGSKYFQLKHATADEIEPILTDLFTGRDRLTRGSQQPGGRNQPASSDDVEADPEPRIISDPRTNQIIVYATQADITEIGTVIDNLDVPTQVMDDRIHVIRLKNLEAVDTAEVLTSLIEAASIFGKEAGTSTSSGGNTGRAANLSSDSVDPREEEKPAVVADEKSNSIIIAGTQRQFEEIKKVLDEIDVQKDQVLIEAALIELTLDDSYRLSVELGAADDNGLVKNDKVSGFAFNNFGQTVFADKDGDTFFTDRIPPFVDSDSNVAPRGLVGGIFAFGQVPLIFNVLNSIQRSRILQLPSILTADNEEAVIQVQDEQAFSESNATTGGAVSGGLGGFETAGTTLRISPHIADATYLLLNINLEVSAFVGEPRTLPSGDQIPADRIRRSLTTVVTVPDRHTVVLGGLMGRTQRSTDDKIPYVSELPVLGELFKSTSRSDRETSLFLFVTPTIMHGGQQAFDILDIESCRRKQKADELIGYTDIYNAKFVGCEQQDSATGCYTGGASGGTYESRRPACVPGVSNAAPAASTEGTYYVPGSGSASDRMDSIGMLEATRFHAVSAERLDAERNARRAALRTSAPTDGSRMGSPRGRGLPQPQARRVGSRPAGWQVGPNQPAPAANNGWTTPAASGSSSEGMLNARGYWKTGGT